MKRSSRALIYCALVLAGIFHFDHCVAKKRVNYLTGGLLNGNYWKLLGDLEKKEKIIDQKLKVHFLAGLLDAIAFTEELIAKKTAQPDLVTQQLDYRGIKPSALAARLDVAYTHLPNLKIPVIYVIYLELLRMAGKISVEDHYKQLKTLRDRTAKPSKKKRRTPNHKVRKP